MAITTLAQVRSGLQVPAQYIKSPNSNGVAGNWCTLWDRAFHPLPGVWDTTPAGVALVAPVTGQIAFNNPPSGNAYLARFAAMSQRSNVLGTGGAMLLDRLWHNGGFVLNTSSTQTINSVAFPARDENGSSDGVGVLLALIINTTSTTGGPPSTIAVGYTNSNGVAGRIATSLYATTAAVNPCHIYPLNLDVGDVGVRSVQTLTFTNPWTTGAAALIAYRPIALIPTDYNPRALAIDAISGAMPRLFNDSVLELWVEQGANTIFMASAEVTCTFG